MIKQISLVTLSINKKKTVSVSVVEWRLCLTSTCVSILV